MKISRIRLTGCWLLVVYFLSTPVQATDNNGNYAIWGMGNKTCFRYQQARASGADIDRYKDFIMGYLTAFNAISEDTYRISGRMNMPQILDWVDSYCDENKMSAMESLLLDFVAKHYDKRMQSAPSGKRGR